MEEMTYQDDYNVYVDLYELMTEEQLLEEVLACTDALRQYSPRDHAAAQLDAIAQAVKTKNVIDFDKYRDKTPGGYA